MKDAPEHRGCEHATCRGLLLRTLHQSPSQPHPGHTSCVDRFSVRQNVDYNDACNDDVSASARLAEAKQATYPQPVSLLTFAQQQRLSLRLGRFTSIK